MLSFKIINDIITIQIGVKLLADILIYSAGLLWSIELIPQVYKTIKTRDVKGISPAFLAICATAYVIYTIGNILIGNWNIVIAHIPSLVLWFYMLILVSRYSKNGKKKRKIK